MPTKKPRCGREGCDRPIGEPVYGIKSGSVNRDFCSVFCRSTWMEERDLQLPPSKSCQQKDCPICDAEVPYLILDGEGGTLEQRLIAAKCRIEHNTVFVFRARNQMDLMFHVVSGDSSDIVLGTMCETPEDKDAAAAAVRELAVEKHAILVATMGEVWYMSPPKGVSIEEAMKMQPSKSPDRREALMISFDSVIDHEMVLWPIKRDSNGTASLGPPERIRGPVKGRMTGQVQKAN